MAGSPATQRDDARHGLAVRDRAQRRALADRLPEGAEIGLQLGAARAAGEHVAARLDLAHAPRCGRGSPAAPPARRRGPEPRAGRDSRRPPGAGAAPQGRRAGPPNSRMGPSRPSGTSTPFTWQLLIPASLPDSAASIGIRAAPGQDEPRRFGPSQNRAARPSLRRTSGGDMKTADAISEILRREGVEWVIGYPVNHILEHAAKIGHPADHRPPGADRPAHGGRGLAGHQRPQDRHLLHAARARHRERLWRRRPGLQRIGADPGDADGLYAPARLGAAQLQRLAQHAGHHQVGRAADFGSEIPTVFRRAFTRLRSGRGGPVLVEIPVDVWNEEIDSLDYVPARPAQRPGPRGHSAGGGDAGQGQAAGDLCRPGHALGRGMGRAAAAGRAAGNPGLHQPRRQKLFPGDASAGAGLGRPGDAADGAPLPRPGGPHPRYRLQLHRDRFRRRDAKGQDNHSRDARPDGHRQGRARRLSACWAMPSWCCRR